jgi:hypothetical protein
MSAPGSRPGQSATAGQMAWRKLDVAVAPGRYHFASRAPQLPMRFRRAAVMRGYDTDLTPPVGDEITLTVHDRPGPGATPIADADLPRFDVDADGTVRPRPS